MQSSKEQQGEIRKPSSVINANKRRKTIDWGKLEISSRKLEIPKEHFMQDGHKKGQMDLTEAEDIKKGWEEYTEELYKKNLHDPHNHNGVTTHLEPDIVECNVKRALGSITTNKAGIGDGIPVELFQILKDDAVKVLQSACQQIWKSQQWPEDWKRSVFIPVPKKGNTKGYSNYRAIALISQASKVMLKFLQARLQQYMNCELPDIQAGFRKGRETREQIDIC